MLELESKEKANLNEEQLEILFDEMIQMCLWGNATDLSLLPTMDYTDIQTLQSVGKAAQAANKTFILRNDSKAVWDLMKSLKNARLDIVLDNSGFELFTDLVLADFLVTYTPFISKVIFHPKLIPWFVSDVVPADFAFMLSPTADWTSFFTSNGSEATISRPKEDIQALDKLMFRWRTYISDGTFQLSVDSDSLLGLPSTEEGTKIPERKGAAYWTFPDSFWSLPFQDVLLDGFKSSGLVIFKGDLNYRKLTTDAKWPPTTSFSEAIGPVRGLFPILSLRTCKADVIVGLPDGVAEKLDADEKERGWRINGKYALITFESQS